MLSEVRTLRAQMLLASESLAASGLVPTRAVEKIRSGRGSLDTAKDLSELSALFTKHQAAFEKNSPLRKSHAKQAASLSAEALSLLTPGAAKKDRRTVPSETLAAIDLRDRLATLLSQRYSDLRAAGFYLHREALDAHIPALQSRRAASKKPTPTPTPPAE